MSSAPHRQHAAYPCVAPQARRTSPNKGRGRSRLVSRILWTPGVTPIGRTVVIPLGLRLPAGSSDQPDGLGGPPLTPSYLVLLRMGFAELPESPPTLVRSYRTVSPLVPRWGAGLLSVALSLGSPPAAVSSHPALCSPDFPPVPTQRDGTGDHPAGFDPTAVYHARGIVRSIFPPRDAENPAATPRKAPGLLNPSTGA